MPQPPLPNMNNWSKGQPFKASHLNEPIDAIRALAFGLATAQPVEAPGRMEQWPGTIVDKGPNGEAAKTTEQYWVQKQVIQGGNPSDPVMLDIDTSDTFPDASAPTIFLVSNLPEMQNHQHSLPVGANVWVWAWFDMGDSPGAGGSSSKDPAQGNNKHYLMCESAVSMRPATLAHDGGAAGTNGPPPTAATYTYTATPIGGGTAYGTTLAVWPARQLGHVTAATKGYIDTIGGTMYVVIHDEVLDTTGCA